MKLKSITPWFGGKRSMANDIIEELGKHRAYFEPFCGSMAVLLQKPVASHETLCDLHKDLTNLGFVIQSDRAPELYNRLMRVLCIEDLFVKAREAITEPFDIEMEPEVSDRQIERAFWYFIVCWIGRNGVSGAKRINYQMAVRWTPGGGHGGIRFRSAVESLPFWHRRLQATIILNRDAFPIIEKIDDTEGVSIYIDSPYMKDTRGSCEYVHEFSDGGDGMFAHQDDHARLADLLKRFTRSRVVVSYYDCGRVRDLYDGWTFRDMTRQKNLHVQNRRGMGECEAPEVLILNGPSYAGAIA